ncbi:hypothetical protein G7Y89_g9594 [Cudoniella acicularis]|uniref:Protein kinase domain-containing protein n=1 Tax=Cudoniella acicularis TaxID=354080 RepID=A0A8H4VZH4_9HELO|nr:hypothetical protein G7Y89_g9594 [Cudoniella acicularis]
MISFGKLTYRLEYTEDLDTYQKNIRIFFTYYLRRPIPPPEISATPSPWDIVLDSWLCKRTVGLGGFITVCAAKNLSAGKTEATKFFVRNRKKWPEIAKEFNIYDHIPTHPCLLQKAGVYYEIGDRWLVGPSDVDEAHERYGLPALPEKVAIITTPYAQFILHHYLPSLSLPARLLVFRQILESVSVLHSAEVPFIHRDLKPSNIGTISYEGPQVELMILDYGQRFRCSPGIQRMEMQGLKDTKLQKRRIRSMEPLSIYGLVESYVFGCLDLTFILREIPITRGRGDVQKLRND